MKRFLIALTATVLISAPAVSGDLPAPPTAQEQQCQAIFEGIEGSMRQDRDFFYDVYHITNRDELAKRMVAFGATQGMIGMFRNDCPADAEQFPAAAMLLLAHHLIDERFGAEN